MREVNSSFGTSWSPMTAIASGGTSSGLRAESSPPQPAAANVMTHAVSRAVSLRVEMLIGIPGGLCGQSEFQDSIDQRECRLKTVGAPGDLAAVARVDRSVRVAAQLTELSRAEDKGTDRCAAAAEHEVVGAEPGELELRFLDPEEVLDRLWNRTVPILQRGVELAELVLGLGESEPAVQVG